jgi:hypothetical protein
MSKKNPSQESALNLWDEHRGTASSPDEAPDPLFSGDTSEKPADWAADSPAAPVDNVLTTKVTTEQWLYLIEELQDDHVALYALRPPNFSPYNPESYKGDDFLRELPERLELLHSEFLVNLRSAENNCKRKRSMLASSEEFKKEMGSLDKEGEESKRKKVRREE